MCMGHVGYPSQCIHTILIFYYDRTMQICSIFRRSSSSSSSGASLPPCTLEQVPPSPSPPLPPPLPFPSLSLPLEVGPLIAARGLGERFSSPSGSGRSPAAKRYLVNFRLKISPLVAMILIINVLPPKFLQKRFPYFFHGAFALSFIWSRRP